MKTLVQYVAEVSQNPEAGAEFVLLKRPSAGGPAPDVLAAAARDARTATLAITATEAPDPEWRVVPLPPLSSLPDGASLAIGRGPRCDIVLPYNSVSKLHASLHAVRNGLTVNDEGSANGTFVNGRRIVAGDTVALAPGSTVTFGGVTFELVPLQTALDAAKSIPPR